MRLLHEEFFGNEPHPVMNALKMILEDMLYSWKWDLKSGSGFCKIGIKVTSKLSLAIDHTPRLFEEHT